MKIVSALKPMPRKPQSFFLAKEAVHGYPGCHNARSMPSHWIGKWTYHPHARRFALTAFYRATSTRCFYLPLAVVEQETRALLESMSDDPRFIVNLGHGILPKTPIAAVRRLVNTVTTWQRSKT